MAAAPQHIVIDARNRRSSTGRYTDRLLEHLQAISNPDLFRFTILLEPDDPWRPRAAHFDVAPCPFPQFSFNPLNDLRFAYLLRKLKPDLVHFTMTQQPLSYRGNNIITTTHDLTMLRFVRAGRTPKPIFWLKKMGYRLLFNAAHNRSSQIIVPTNFVKQDLTTNYPATKGKVTVTYEASEPVSSKEAIAPRDVKAPFIMHVGSPFPHKNLRRLIEAFELLLQKHPKLTLILAGKKEFYFEELELWAKQRPSYESIRFTGFIEDAELTWLYQNAEAYVLPSLSEGFGLPGLEAMAHDCPLASSNATCLPEVYGEAALFFNPYDTAEIAKVTDQLITDRTLRKQLIKAGQARLQQFSWRSMAKQTLEVYARTLDS